MTKFFVWISLGLSSVVPLPFAHAKAAPSVDPEKVFSEMKIYDDKGHPYRRAIEDWAGARARVANDPTWAKWLQDGRERCDKWMAKHQDRPDWSCGYWHDFVSDKDGSVLVWTDEVPGVDVKYFHSATDPQVEVTPKRYGGWVFVFRQKHNEQILRAAQFYRMTDNKKYADWVLAQLMFYADNYERWAPGPKEGHLFYSTLDESTNFINYVEALRLLGDYVKPEQKEILWKKLFEPTTALINKGWHANKIHNITVWHDSMLAQVALYFGKEDLWRNTLDSEFGVKKQLSEGITRDYIWCEQSIGYNRYVLRALRSLFIAAGLYGRIDEVKNEMAIAENLLLSPMYMRFPDLTVPAISDATGSMSVPDSELMGIFYRVFPMSIGFAEAAKQKNWDTLLDPPPPVTGSLEMPAVTSRNMESTRLALLKSGKWQLFLQYGQIATAHSQPEALNFMVFYGDTAITRDSGTIMYGSKLHAEYFTAALNHNVPLINGEGEVHPQRGELLEFSTDPARVSAAQPEYRPGVKAKRTLSIVGEKLVDVAEIENVSGGEEKLGLSLQLQGKVKLPAEFKEDAKFADGRPMAFSYWKNVRGASFKDKVEFDVHYEKLVVHITISVPGEFRIWHASTPDTPVPNYRDGFYLETMGASKTFTTTFEPVALELRSH